MPEWGGEREGRERREGREGRGGEREGREGRERREGKEEERIKRTTFDIKLTITIAKCVKQQLGNCSNSGVNYPQWATKHYPYLDGWYQSTRPTQCTHAGGH